LRSGWEGELNLRTEHEFASPCALMFRLHAGALARFREDVRAFIAEALGQRAADQRAADQRPDSTG
jgi:hypothetical protein